MLKNKKGKMEWEYLATIIIVLIVIVLTLLFGDFIKKLIIEKWKDFVDAIKNIIGA